MQGVSAATGLQAALAAQAVAGGGNDSISPFNGLLGGGQAGGFAGQGTPLGGSKVAPGA